MKKIFSYIAAAIVAISPATAQYMPTTVGTQMVFKATSYDDGEKTMEIPATVISVDTAADGVITTKYELVQKVDDFNDIKTYKTCTYNPATQITTDYVATPDETLDALVNMLIESAKSQGVYPTDDQIAELRKAIKIKGELKIELPADPDLEAKVANQNMKIFIEAQTISKGLWEFKYLGFETVEVPAGTYENCLKVSYISKETSPQATEKHYCTSWYAKGLGEIKSIIADKKGKVLVEEVLLSVK